jgi:hypothetical protein
LYRYAWVSLSHAAAIAHANAGGVETAVFIESDSVGNNHGGDERDDEGVIADMSAALALPRETWNVIRLGWRSRSMEDYDGGGCTPGCSCGRPAEMGEGSKMCLLANEASMSDPSGELEAAAVRAAAVGYKEAGEGGGGANCDIRGSDSYVLHRGSFELVHRR